MIQPVFILSLPRSGSTLAQRILGRSPQISTVAEPWFLLPLFYSLKPGGQFSEYWHNRSVEAVTDFVDGLPGGRGTYLTELGEAARRLYAQAADEGAVYFLDKTPRYHLIAGELPQAFPDGKAIVLWRNPLAIAASMMETWANGHWNLYVSKIDLFAGITNLIDFCQRDAMPTHQVKFESIVTSPEETWAGVFEFLDLPFDESVLKDFSEVDLAGRMGDPTGSRRYQQISEEPLQKWTTAFCNPLRKSWARKYLAWLGEERLAYMGYDKRQLEEELSQAPVGTRYLLSDVIRRVFGLFFCLGEPEILGAKWKSLGNWRKVYGHR